MLHAIIIEMKLLLHTCCAPCSVYCIQRLREEGIEPTLFWYNPNIHPFTEYQARRDCLKEYAKLVNVELALDDTYGLDEFCRNVIDRLDTRCVDYCYPTRLRRAFEYAKENGFNAITTTLLYSIYQKHDAIVELMEGLAKEYGIEFVYRDFREGWYVGQEEARRVGLYMQKYCGCVFSEEERYLSTNPPKLRLPDGFEFLPVKRKVVIRKEKDNKQQFAELFGDALAEGDVYVLTCNDKTACVALVSEIDNDSCELRQLSLLPQFKEFDYDARMVKFLADNLKQKYGKLIVGAQQAQIPFFVKQGFETFEESIRRDGLTFYSKELK